MAPAEGLLETGPQPRPFLLQNCRDNCHKPNSSSDLAYKGRNIRGRPRTHKCTHTHSHTAHREAPRKQP